MHTDIYIYIYRLYRYHYYQALLLSSHEATCPRSLSMHLKAGHCLESAIRGRFIDMLVPCPAVNLPEFNKIRPGYSGYPKQFRPRYLRYLGISWKILVAFSWLSPKGPLVTAKSHSESPAVPSDSMVIFRSWLLTLVGWWLNPLNMDNLWIINGWLGWWTSQLNGKYWKIWIVPSHQPVMSLQTVAIDAFAFIG